MAEKETGTRSAPSKSKSAPRLIKPRPRKIEDPVLTEELATEKAAEQTLAIKPQEEARFQFFLIDSGWDGPVPKLLRQNLRMITQLQNHDPFYVLSRTQSNELLRRHPHLIGKDPILIARDISFSRANGKDQYHGFHLNLGIIQNPERALEVLQNFLNFLAIHRKNSNIDQVIRAQLHRDGLQGAVEVLRGGSEAMI